MPAFFLLDALRIFFHTLLQTRSGFQIRIYMQQMRQARRFQFLFPLFQDVFPEWKSLTEEICLFTLVAVRGTVIELFSAVGTIEHSGKPAGYTGLCEPPAVFS